MNEPELRNYADLLIHWLEDQDLDLIDAIAVSGIAIGALAIAMAKDQDAPVSSIMEDIITCMRASVGASRQ